MDRRTGKPITDLKQGDFTIAEDGTPQEIRLFISSRSRRRRRCLRRRGRFLSQAFSPPSGRAARALAPQRARIFLFVLGSGRLHGGPVKGLDAAIDFIRHRLLPQDFVAASATTAPPTSRTDHEVIARVVERFPRRNDAIMATVLQHVSGLGGVYGSRGMPPVVQGRIDAVFAGPARHAVREDRGRRERPVGRPAARRHAKARRGRVRRRRRRRAPGASERLGRRRALPSIDWSGFDQFAATSALTMQDLGNLYAAIAYMQKIEGEKHLVFITESGPACRGATTSPTSRGGRQRRVAVDIVQTGEAFDVTSNGWLRASRRTPEGLPRSRRTDPRRSTDWTDDAKWVPAGLLPAQREMGRQRAARDGEGEPGECNVVYRRGYLAYPGGREFDRRAYLTRFRLAAATSRNADLADIKVTLAAAAATIDGNRQWISTRRSTCRRSA